MGLQVWHDFAEQIKPILECIAISVGALTLIKWYWEWNNRATDVLLKLEEEFDKKCKAGRMVIENESMYRNIAEVMEKTVRSGNRCDLAGSEQESLREIDDLLRFYVVLYGVREAKQVPERSLSICYRFWMAHYYRKDRVALRQYVNEFFPTLKGWLLSDASWSRRLYRRPLSRWWRCFFRAHDFWERRLIEDRLQ